MNESNPLILSILDEAEAKARLIIKNAETECQGIFDDEKTRLSSLVKNEDDSFENKKKLIEERKESAERNIDRLLELKKMDTLYTLVMDNVDTYFDRRIKDNAFRTVLLSWSVEALIGLSLEEAYIDYSPLAPLSEDDIREIERRYKDETKNNIKVHLGKMCLKSAGIVARDKEHNLSYSNTLEVRLRRFSKEIRKIILDENAKNNR